MRSAAVLVVDDEFLIRWALRQRLERAGYTVHEAAEGLAAVELFAAAIAIDLVLLDYRLPDIDGFEVLRRIRALGAQTPVVMLTAHASAEMAEDAYRRGVLQFTGKPFDLDDVAELVARAVA